jgi:hypothetical protein
MGFAEEFGHQYEVPRILPFLMGKGILQDMSWHNDAAPSFGLRGEEKGEHSLEVRLWVDHILKTHREVGGRRYTVTVMEDDDQTFSKSTDDLEEALLILFKQLAKYHKWMGPRVLDWYPDDVPVTEWDDAEEYFHDLAKEYLKDPGA